MALKSEEKPRDGYPDSIPMSNEKQMSHRLSRAVKIIKEQGKKYPEQKNRFCSEEASWTPPERARETAGRGPSWTAHCFSPQRPAATRAGGKLCSALPKKQLRFRH